VFIYSPAATNALPPPSRPPHDPHNRRSQCTVSTTEYRLWWRVVPRRELNLLNFIFFSRQQIIVALSKLLRESCSKRRHGGNSNCFVYENRRTPFFERQLSTSLECIMTGSALLHFPPSCNWTLLQGPYGKCLNIFSQIFYGFIVRQLLRVTLYSSGFTNKIG